MSSFAENFWGDKNTGFGVLYQNMKQGHVSIKELADFVRERAIIEEAYSKSMAKLSKMASNSSQLGTFAPMWDVFRVSSDKLSLCHMELMKKLQDLIKDINRYGEEQLKVHKKCKEEVSGTLEAMQALHSSSQVLHKAKENHYSKCLEYERLRKEGASQKELDKAELKTKKAGSVLGASVQKYNLVRAEFEQKMLESAQRFQKIEEVNLRHMKELMGSYIHSIEDTHVQIGQVQEEFKQNVENCSTADLIRRFIESKGTGRDKPGVLDPDSLPVPAAGEGVKRTRSKPFRIPGLSRKDKTSEALDCPDADSLSCREVDEEGFTLRLDVNQTEEPENHLCSSSDSDFDDEEPRRFRIQIKPVQPHHENCNPEAAVEQLRITVGNLILPPSSTASIKRHSSREPPPLPSITGDVDSDAPAGTESGKRSVPPPATDTHSSSTQSTMVGLPSQALFGPPLESVFQTDDLTVISTTNPDVTEIVPCLRSWLKLPYTNQLMKNSEAYRSLSPSYLLGPSPLLLPPSSLTERGFLASPQPGIAAVLGLSRGPSPVVLGTQDTLPVAAAFTEYIDAFFRGDFESCLTRINGEMAMSFPAGIVRIFSSISPPPVLSFRLLNTAQVNHFIPNPAILYSDLSQSDPSTRDFWLNMQALSSHLQRQAEENPSAPYYNVTLLKYQVSKPGHLAAPLKLAVTWKRTIVSTEVTVKYRYNAGAMATPTPLTNLQFLLPVEEPVASMELQPMASWNSEEKRLLWQLPDACDEKAPGGSGTLIASWEPLCGPTTTSPVAAQFISEGSTLSGIGMELVGSGYRMSLVKKRFATGKYLVGF
uniref:F-BAR domain only protein 1 isoform X2 n=1 Tax=Geotrypetes seraphini TaxID=260995 RepID=A0A6P8RY20_GEOSA|nr:F-BAR domain only protein 1 isoform X2 [Geotrypetes seraphini]